MGARVGETDIDKMSTYSKALETNSQNAPHLNIARPSVHPQRRRVVAAVTERADLPLRRRRNVLERTRHLATIRRQHVVT